ncbi:hypothetical protein BX070DRAFT_250747 [Coemansia spiralis]|nr:hypothetical protein BX070DRAFT_250747 [Coemansia spiralis]
MFKISRIKLRHAMQDAARDHEAYNKVYNLFAKRADSGSPEDTLDAALKPIEESWMQKRDKRLRQDGQGDMEHFSSGISHNMPNDVKRQIALLQVLHGIVLSFPFEMASMLGDRQNASRLHYCTVTKTVPTDIRMVLVALASRWCVLFMDNPKAFKSMAFIVDGFFQEHGRLPGLSFLPSAPDAIRIQASWRYPSMVPKPNDAAYMYIPLQAQQQIGLQKYDSVSRQTILAEQQAALSQLSPHSPQEATPELLGRMDSCSQELTALSSMLIENLASLPVDEDPRNNDIVRDMMREVDRLYEIVSNYILVLSHAHDDVAGKLDAAIEEARRGQWMFRDAVNMFETQRRKSCSPGATSERIKTVRSQLLLSEDCQPDVAEQRGAADAAGASTKARGKMPDLSPPDSEEQLPVST